MAQMCGSFFLYNKQQSSISETNAARPSFDRTVSPTQQKDPPLRTMDQDLMFSQRNNPYWGIGNRDFQFSSVFNEKKNKSFDILKLFLIFAPSIA